MTDSKTPCQTNGNGPPLRPEAMASGEVATDDQNSTWRELEARVEELEAWVDHLSKESAEKDHELVRRQERLEAAEAERDALRADLAEAWKERDEARAINRRSLLGIADRVRAEEEVERLRGALKKVQAVADQLMSGVYPLPKDMVRKLWRTAEDALHSAAPSPRAEEPIEVRTEPDVLFRCPRCRFEHWCWKGRSGHVHLCEGCGHAWSASESESPPPAAPGVAGEHSCTPDCPGHPDVATAPDPDTLPTLSVRQVRSAVQRANDLVMFNQATPRWQQLFFDALNLPPPAERKEGE